MHALSLYLRNKFSFMSYFENITPIKDELVINQQPQNYPVPHNLQPRPALVHLNQILKNRD